MVCCLLSNRLWNSVYLSKEHTTLACLCWAPISPMRSTLIIGKCTEGGRWQIQDSKNNVQHQILLLSFCKVPLESFCEHSVPGPGYEKTVYIMEKTKSATFCLPTQSQVIVKQLQTFVFKYKLNEISNFWEFPKRKNILANLMRWQRICHQANGCVYAHFPAVCSWRKHRWLCNN